MNGYDCMYNNVVVSSINYMSQVGETFKTYDLS